MRWSKIKNIILLLLVIVNLALLGLVGLRAYRTAQNQRLAREHMVDILAGNGISFLPDQVPDRMDLLPLRVDPEGAATPSLLPAGVSIWTVRGDRSVEVEPSTLEGAWTSSAPGGEPISASTALMRILEALNRGGYVCSQITAMYPGYSLTGSAPLTLTPMWYVETDSYRFAVDAYTGTVAAEE